MTPAPVARRATTEHVGMARIGPNGAPVIFLNPLMLLTRPAQLRERDERRLLGDPTGRDQGWFRHRDLRSMYRYFINNPGSPWGHLPGPQRLQHFANCFGSPGEPQGAKSASTCTRPASTRTAATRVPADDILAASHYVIRLTGKNPPSTSACRSGMEGFVHIQASAPRTGSEAPLARCTVPARARCAKNSSISPAAFARTRRPPSSRPRNRWAVRTTLAAERGATGGPLA